MYLIDVEQTRLSEHELAGRPLYYSLASSRWQCPAQLWSGPVEQLDALILGHLSRFQLSRCTGPAASKEPTRTAKATKGLLGSGACCRPIGAVCSFGSLASLVHFLICWSARELYLLAQLTRPSVSSLALFKSTGQLNCELANLSLGGKSVPSQVSLARHLWALVSLRVKIAQL